MATNVTYFFTPLVLLLIPEDCHDEFFVKFNFFDVPCLKIAISKGLGYAIILGAVVVKVPQIMKMLKAKSGAGVSIASLFFEMTAITFTMAYSVHKNFPFSSWGETFFMCIQDIIITLLTFIYGGSTLKALLFAPIYIGINYALCTPAITPFAIIVKLQEFNLVVLLLSRFIQIWANFSSGHTGQLSVISQSLIAFGSLARVFTTIQETGDMLMTSQFILACSLNCMILGQIFWYWNVAPEKAKKE